MKMFQKKYFVLILIPVILIAALGIAMANTPVRTPDGFDKVVVFMAAGQYNQSIPPAEGDLGMWFHKEIMGRSDQEILDEKAAAEAYFEEMFGPELPEPVAFGVDPRNEYRAYFISGMDIPSEGWVVRDGGFMIAFMTDTTLHGEWGGLAGKTVPVGSFVVFGEYNIDVTGPGKSGKHPSYVEPIIIHYQSAEPIIPEMITGGMAFVCTVIAPWGQGVAQGTVFTQMLGNGIVQANIRNVHTYPAYGPSIVHNSP